MLRARDYRERERERERERCFKEFSKIIRILATNLN